MELAHSYIGPSTELDNTKTQQALKFTPPLSNIYEAAFYEFKSWASKISYFKNNILYRKNLGLLIGANGSGKTTLFQKLTTEIPSQFFVHRLLGDAKLKLEDLVSALQASLDIPRSNDIITLEQIDQIVYQFLANQDYFLFVDDAHKIPLETLEGLLRIANNAKEFPRLQIFLCGDIYLTKRIKSIQERLGREVDFPIIELSALSFDETRDYVEFLLLKMNADREVFSDLMWQRLYSLSGGFPGRINRVAQQILRDRDKFEQQFNTDEEQLAESNKRSQFGYRLSLTVSLLLLLTSIVYYFYQDWIIQNQKPQVLAHKKNVVHHHPTHIAKRSPMSQDGFAYIASIEGLPIEHIQPKRIAIKKTLQQVDEHLSTQPVVRAKIIQQKQQPVESVEEELEQKPTRASLASNAKLPFTIQLMAGRHRDGLNSYLNLPSIKPKSQIIRSSLDGKDWYVLIYGSFANPQQARAELEQVSAMFKTQKPWIRSIASLSNK